MHFEIIGDIEDVETLASGGRIRDIMRIQKQYGPGRWRKLKGVAKVREKRALEKEIGVLIDILDDVREFSKHLNFIIEERGYVPHIDDGVLLNMAPSGNLFPLGKGSQKRLGRP